MNRRLNIIFLVLLLCSSIFAQSSSSSSAEEILSLYTGLLISNCEFPFTYNGVTYNNCTTADGSMGEIPWCAVKQSNQSIYTYCFDFRKTTLQCLPSYTMPNKQTYTGCAYLSSSAKYQQCKTNNPLYPFRYCTNALSSSTVQPVQRIPNCNPPYANLAQDHSICYSPSPWGIEVPLNSSEIQDILNLHNQYRSAVKSAYMFELSWDTELAKIAQAHADMCIFEHDLAENRMSPIYPWLTGQNIAFTTEIVSKPADLFDAMYSSEKPRFTFGKGCADGDDCLHYTQLMISNITHIGCGQTHCVYPHGIERIVVCNFLFAQYVDTYMTPYVQSSTSAANCPAKNNKGLCNCGSTICNYDKNQHLDPNTCTCQTQVVKRSIDKRDVNSNGIGKNVPKKLKLQHGTKRSRRMSKRTVKTIKLKPRHKRSPNPDVNEDELNKHVVHEMKIRPGKVFDRPN